MLWIKGLEMSLICHFSSCHHGEWSWNELELLHMWVFLPYGYSIWRLGSWKELVSVLSRSFWLVADSDDFLHLSLSGSELLHFDRCVFPSMLWTRNKLLVWSASILDMVFAWFLQRTWMRPNLTLAGCPMMISFHALVSQQWRTGGPEMNLSSNASVIG